jgi:hypothetical protein
LISSTKHGGGFFGGHDFISEQVFVGAGHFNSPQLLSLRGLCSSAFPSNSPGDSKTGNDLDTAVRIFFYFSRFVRGDDMVALFFNPQGMHS